VPFQERFISDSGRPRVGSVGEAESHTPRVSGSLTTSCKEGWNGWKAERVLKLGRMEKSDVREIRAG
jgi:hypothetical protein